MQIETKDMNVRDEELIAAMRKAVEVGLLPRHGPQEQMEDNWQKMREVLAAVKQVVGQ